MNLEGILTFVELAGFSGVKCHDDWVMISCPFAPFNHESGKDSSPSFGIKVVEDGSSGFNCFACEAKGGDLRHLINHLSMMTGKRYKEAYSFVSNNETRSMMKDKVSFGSTFRAVSNKDDDFEDKPEPERPTIDESRLEEFSSRPHKYILNRGLSKKTCNEWGIHTDFTYSKPRVVFPVRNIDGELLAFSRRVVWDKPTCQWCGYNITGSIKFGTSRDEGEPKDSGGCPNCQNRWVWPKYQHSKGFKRNWYLYGEHMINKDYKTGVIVEGNIDPIWLWQCRVENAVATLGSKPGEKWPNKRHGKPGEQIYLMSKYFDKVILMPDPDKAGRSWAKTIKGGLDGRISSDGKSMMKVFVSELPDGKDPADLTKRQVREVLSRHVDIWRK